jgi:F0F1-type ATP synthase membrane subunit b/b'
MLELDLATIIFETLNFLALILLLYHFLFRRVMRNVKARAAEKERLLREAEQDRREAAKTKAELKAQLAGADEEAAAIVAKAQAQAESERTALIQQTQTEVERILAEAHVDAYRTRQQAIDDFHEDMINTILDISGWVVGHTAPQELHNILVQQLSDRVWDFGRNGIEQVEMIRRSLRDRSPTVFITTAQPLTAEQQSQLVDTFSALVDQNVKLEVQTDSALAVGLRVRVGDTVLDNSITGQLDALRDDIRQMLRHRILQEATAPEYQPVTAEVMGE